jgi:catechol 2,3-dioxygenase-like lactoylglutathione lyase family enzyme
MGSSSYEVRTSIAVSDIARAAEFYEGKLGLTSSEEQADESRIYPCGGNTSVHVYESPTQVSPGTATLATWYVPDLGVVIDELASTGVAFERHNDPALKAGRCSTSFTATATPSATFGRRSSSTRPRIPVRTPAMSGRSSRSGNLFDLTRDGRPGWDERLNYT